MRWLLSALLFLSVCIATARGGDEAVRNVSEFYSPSSPTSGIREAINSLPESGGVVVIPAGTYLLKRSIRLCDNVCIRGDGFATVLKKCEQAISPLTESAPAGGTFVIVKGSTGFEVGMEIGIKDDSFGGWFTTHAIVKSIEGQMLLVIVGGNSVNQGNLQ